MSLAGWDHVSHFDMVEMIRTYGTTIDRLPPAFDDTSWFFSSYPQAFHAGLATVMDFLVGAEETSRHTELIGYSRGTALILIAAAVMVAAGLCSLPRLRQLPWVGLPVATLAAGAFLLGPGAVGPARGHANFILATALTAAVALAVVTQDRVLRPLPLAAIGGAVVGVAHGWLALLTMTLLAVPVMLVPTSRDRWRANRRQVVLSCLIVVATGTGLIMAITIIATGPPVNLVTATGGVEHNPLTVLVRAATVPACLVASGLLVADIRRHRSSRLSDSDRRTAWLIGVPVIAALVIVVLAIAQYRAVGELRYYLYKFVIATQLVSIVILTVIVGTLLVRWILRRSPLSSARHSKIPLVMASLLATLATTQVFGYTGPTFTDKLNPLLSPGMRTQGRSEIAALNPPTPRRRLPHWRIFKPNTPIATSSTCGRKDRASNRPKPRSGSWPWPDGGQTARQKWPGPSSLQMPVAAHRSRSPGHC
ncbi:MAG: hypothetical protein Q8P61_09595 [Candidatus Nanopelagicales bacterium]|nr:hypothetical protein [Candidatus Nanopelagicales bacterium]